MMDTSIFALEEIGRALGTLTTLIFHLASN